MNFFKKFFYPNKARVQALKNLTKELNLQFIENEDTGLVQQLSEFKLFKKGSSKKINNLIIQSELNLKNQVFDYQYTISTGKSSKTFRQTVLFIDSRELSLPQFYQKPENFLNKLLAFLGFEDIDFIHFPEYSDKYHLNGEYEEVIRHYFTKEVLELLTTQKDLYMEGMNYYFILYQYDTLCSVDNIDAFRNLGIMLYQLFLLRSKENEASIF